MQNEGVPREGVSVGMKRKRMYWSGIYHVNCARDSNDTGPQRGFCKLCRTLLNAPSHRIKYHSQGQVVYSPGRANAKVPSRMA